MIRIHQQIKLYVATGFCIDCKAVYQSLNMDYLDNGIIWKLEDCTFEKMGDLMARNGRRLLALNDEFSSFLSNINVFHGRNITDNHELGQFLQLYNGDSWTRETGEHIAICTRSPCTYNNYFTSNLVNLYHCISVNTDSKLAAYSNL